MAEEFKILTDVTRKEQYEYILPQIKALLKYENDYIANMANIAAAIKESFNFLWVGFYRVEGEELILAPFQGPIACTRIKYGKGVCGTAWRNKKTLIVPDVGLFPGHIACSSLSKSEIVIPIINNDVVVGVLDIDSNKINEFNEVDAFYLEKISSLLNIE